MQATPLEIAAGYAMFANGGYHVQPYFIDRIENCRAVREVVCGSAQQPRQRYCDHVRAAASPSRSPNA